MSPPPDPQRFVVLLRSRGIAVPVGSAVRFTEALGILRAPAMPDLYWAARCTLVVRHTDFDVFDEAFAEFFFHTPRPAGDGPQAAEDFGGRTVGTDGASDSEEPQAPEQPEVQQVAWSRLELLARRDLAECTAEEVDELHAAIRQLRLDPPTVATRRRRPARRGRLDVRRTIRASMRSGSELTAPRFRDRSSAPRRLVLLVDVSGSMTPYSRTLLRFGHAAVQSSRRVEVFGFATRLTRLTHQLRISEPDAALARATAATEDMSGGTRLGEVLAEFNQRWAMRGTARGAVVVILSDGWDRGQRGLVDAEMGRLARISHRVVWVNPLKATDGYEPLAGGMAEALDHVDDFVEGHSLESLVELAALVGAPASASERTATVAGP
ncbi:MAG: vWA domain-containing protein [Microthrixaceae bacterium]